MDFVLFMYGSGIVHAGQCQALARSDKQRRDYDISRLKQNQTIKTVRPASWRRMKSISHFEAMNTA